MMPRYKKNITSDELKTIAATSAIAAAGGALATALVTYAVDRWVLKSEQQAGPTFVVVPVVEREVPPQVVNPPPADPQPPLIAGYGRPFGALTPSQQAQIKQLAPWRYWEEFYKCWNDEEPAYRAHCRQLTQMYEAMDDTDQEQMDDIVGDVPNVGKTEFMTYMLLAAGGGMAVGALLATLGRA